MASTLDATSRPRDATRAALRRRSFQPTRSSRQARMSAEQPFRELGGRRLAPERELRLVLAAQRGGERERAQLIEAFMPSIVAIARLYRRAGSVDRDELIQDGVVGILRALRRFDAALEIPFWGYASWWVRQAMQQLVSERSRPMVMSDRAARHLARVLEAQRRLEQSRRREPSCGDLAVAAGLRRSQVESLLALERRPRGFDDVASGQDHSGTSLGELLPDPGAEQPYDNALDRIVAGQLPRLLSQLPDRQREVVCARYGIGTAPQTLRQLAATLDLSAERVRQIECTAVEHLREAVSG